MMLRLDELIDLVQRALSSHGMRREDAAIVARTIVAAERDGAHSHGLQRLPGYISSLRAGWVDARAVPTIRDASPGFVHANACNGFAQIALARADGLLRKKAQLNGIAALGIHNSHHFASLWPDLEPFAEDGFVALTMVNTRSRIVAWGGKKKILGTNPMAFACPRPGYPPLIWDQASSIMSQGDILLSAAAGRSLPVGIGVDANGAPTTSAEAVLRDGALMPFGGVKGSSLAFMVEILAAALTKGNFGFEDRSGRFPGAETSNAGQFFLLMDPSPMAGKGFPDRVAALIARLLEAGSLRMPGDLRYKKRRQAEAKGIQVSSKIHNYLLEQLAQ